MTDSAPKPRRGLSLGLTVPLSLLAVVLAPLLFVFLVSWLGEAADARLRDKVRDVAQEAVQDPTPTTLARVAERHRVRIRLLNQQGETVRQFDHGPRNENSLGVASTSYGRETYPEPRPVELPVGQPSTWNGCELSEDRSVLRCHAGARRQTDGGPVIVYVERQAVRGVQELVGAKSPLWRLSAIAIVTGVLLSLFLFWQLIVPLRRLRSEVLTRETNRNDTDAIQVRAPSEIDDVTQAFNRLVRALHDERIKNSRFVEDLAHELKTPLATIRAAVELLESSPNEGRQELSERVDSSVARIDRTVSHMLELARMEGNAVKDNGHQETVDLSAIVENVLELFAEPSDRSNITLERSLESAQILGDPNALGRLVTCLLENAVSFASSRVEVSVQSGSEVTLTVHDDGPGFPEESLDRVFDRFFTRRAGGTGIGMALARAVAEAHHGNIQASNAEGGRVVVRFPK